MQRVTRVLIVCLFIVNCVLGAYVFFNFFDIPNALFNSVGPTVTRSFNPTYPQQSGDLIYIANSSQFLNVDVQLTTEGAFVAGTPVIVQAVGNADSASLTNVESVWVGFDGAETYGTPSDGEVLGGSFGGAILTPNQTDVSGVPGFGLGTGGQYLIGSTQTIDFPNPTTYVLVMKILYNNLAPPLILHYPGQTIYVNSSDYFGQQRTIRFDYSVGLMAAIDIIAASAVRLLGAWKGDQSENTQTAKPTIRKQKPDNKPQPNNAS